MVKQLREPTIVTTDLSRPDVSSFTVSFLLLWFHATLCADHRHWDHCVCLCKNPTKAFEIFLLSILILLALFGDDRKPWPSNFWWGIDWTHRISRSTDNHWKAATVVKWIKPVTRKVRGSNPRSSSWFPHLTYWDPVWFYRVRIFRLMIMDLLPLILVVGTSSYDPSPFH